MLVIEINIASGVSRPIAVDLGSAFCCSASKIKPVYDTNTDKKYLHRDTHKLNWLFHKSDAVAVGTADDD